MPLPWKKHRISQLLADLRSPSKRRGSLIVQTGFPTSLFDLFVKNRDRLRKASSRKHSHQNEPGHCRGIDSSDIASTTPPPTEIPVRAPPPTIPLSNSTEGATTLRRPNRGQFGGEDAINIAGGRYCDGVNGNEAMEHSDSSGSFVNRVFAAVLKTLVVVALALSTKKLVVGITLSAFALLLLECVGKHMDADGGVILRPCRMLLDSILLGLSFIRPKKGSRRLEKCKASKRLVLLESSMVCDSLGQIETVGCSNFEEENGGGEEGAGLGPVIVEREHNYVDMRIGMEGNEHKDEKALLYGKNQGRSNRIKSKIIKKCVPKKLRRKKTIKGTELEEDEKEKSSERSGYFSMEELEDKLGGENNDKDDESQLKLGRGREGNSGYRMLIVIVLVGLVGGRIFAFVLTVVWCLVLKSLGNPRKIDNVPMMRSQR